MNKEIHVVFAEEKIKETFDKLKTGKYENKKLYQCINKAFDDLKLNPFCGIQIQKKLIPKEYSLKFSAANLWKYNLPNAWRLIYTVKEDEITILSIILEWMSHKDYEKRFRY